MAKTEDLVFLTYAIADDIELPAWKSIDIVCRKWAILSGFEKDQANYQAIKEQYE